MDRGDTSKAGLCSAGGALPDRGSLDALIKGGRSTWAGGMSESDRTSLLRTLTLKERDGKVTKVRTD